MIIYKRIQKSIIFFFLGYLGLVLILLGVGSIFVATGLQAAKAKNFDQALYWLSWAESDWKVLNKLTLGLAPYQPLVDAGFKTLPHVQPAITALEKAADTSELEIQKIVPLASQLVKTHEQLKAYPQIYQYVLQKVPNLPRLAETLGATSSILESIPEGRHTWLILFQNSDELRGMGGFMGSYALITWQDGTIESVVVEDIYDASGQIMETLPAPPGVSEYLSGGFGLKLPDANWEPDPLLSAQAISDLFVKGAKPKPSLVVFTTTTAVKNLLQSLGPVPMDDGTFLTAETLTPLLSSHHKDYFPGSTKKKQTLDKAITQVRLKAKELSTTEVIKTLDIFFGEIEKRNIAVVSLDSTHQQILESASLAVPLPHLEFDTRPLWIFESNVGINKANAGIERSWEIQASQSKTKLQITTTNTLTPPDPSIFSPQHVGAKHLSYVNFQRIWVEETASISALTVNGTPVESVVSRMLKTYSGQAIQEISFLVETPEKQTSVIQLELTHSQPAINVSLIKQAGLNSIPVLLDVEGKTPELIEISKDFIFAI